MEPSGVSNCVKVELREEPCRRLIADLKVSRCSCPNVICHFYIGLSIPPACSCKLLILHQVYVERRGESVGFSRVATHLFYPLMCV